MKKLFIIACVMVAAIMFGAYTVTAIDWLENDWTTTGYSSKDDNIVLTTTTPVGKIKLSTKSDTPQVDDYSVDFGGNRTGVNISGTGTAAALTMSAASFNDPFVSAPGTWRQPVGIPGQLDAGGGMAYADDGSNEVFVLIGNNTKSFVKMSLATLSVVKALPDAPAPIHAGGRIIYPGFGEYIYVLRGGGTKDFFVYDKRGTGTWITKDSANQPLQVPDIVYDGAAMCYVNHATDGDCLYVLTGAKMFRYKITDPPGNNWSYIQNRTSNTGNNMVNGGDGYIYFGSGGQKSWYKLDIATDVVSPLSDAPETITNAAFSYTGTPGKFYAILYSGFMSNTFSDRKFYLYDNGTWTEICGVPCSTGRGVSLMYPGSGDFVYCLQGSSNTLWKYSITNNIWNVAPLMAESNYEQRGPILDVPYNSATNRLYFNRGDGGSATGFWSTDVGTNKCYSELDGSPGPGSVFCSSGSKIYMLKRNNTKELYVYNTTPTTSWTQLTWPSSGYAAAGAGGAVAHYTYNSNNYLFITGGANTANFYCVNVTGPTPTWSTNNPVTSTALTFPADTVDNGGDLLRAGDYLYLVPKSGSSKVYRYNILDNSWTTLADLPLPLGLAGGHLVYPGSGGDYIYCMRGQGYFEFWKHDIRPGHENDTWISEPDLPIMPSAGCITESGGAYIYFVPGPVTLTNTTNRLVYRYDTLNQVWSDMPKALAGGGNQFAALYHSNFGNWVYVLRGHGSKDFLRYDNTNNKWEYRASVPETPGVGIGTSGTTGKNGMSLSYPGSGDDIYMSKGYSKKVWRYNIIDNIWYLVTDCPQIIGDGGGLGWPGSTVTTYYDPVNNKLLYAYCGHGTAYFYQLKIDITGGIYTYTWTQKSDAKYSSWDCPGTLTSIGTGRKLYLKRQSSLNEFYEYDAGASTQGTWSSSTLAVPSGWGDTRNRVLMAVDGTSVYAYDPSDPAHFSVFNGTSWSSRASAPRAGYDGYLVKCGSNLVLLRNSGDSYFYSPTQNEWSAATSYTTSSDYGKTIVSTKDDYLYTFRGRYNDFYKYNIGTNSWTQMASRPTYSDIFGNYLLLYPGKGKYIYHMLGTSYYAPTTPALTGREMLIFDKTNGSTGSWTIKYTTDTAPNSTLPYALSAAQNIGVALDDYLFVGPGGTNTWLKGTINLDTNGNFNYISWASSSLPIGSPSFGSGCSATIARDGANKYIYVLTGKGGRFYRYLYPNGPWDVTVNDNTPQTDLGVDIDNGACLIYPDFGDYIYLYTGGNKNIMLKYSISGRVWTYAPYLPINDAGGGIIYASSNIMCYPGYGNYIYLWPGSGSPTSALIKYPALAEGTYISDVKNVGNKYNYSTVSWVPLSSPSHTNVAMKVRTFSSMPGSPYIASEWYTLPWITNGQNVSALSSVTNTHNYFQYLAKFYTDPDGFAQIAANPPSVDRVTINYDYYPVSQTLTSNVKPTTFVHDMIRQLTWNPAVTLPPGTGIKLQLRTAPTSSGPWTDWRLVGYQGTVGSVESDFGDGAYALGSGLETEVRVAGLDGVVKLKAPYQQNSDNPPAATVAAAIAVSYDKAAGKYLEEFREVASKPDNTEIRYQVTPNFGGSPLVHYYWNAGASQWTQVTGTSSAYDEASTASDINANISSFMDQPGCSAGNFSYRAILHTTDTNYTPLLDKVKIYISDATKYYTVSGQSIDLIHADGIDDEYIQYKVTLTSDKRDTPTVGDITLSYVAPSLMVNQVGDLPTGGGTRYVTVGVPANVGWMPQEIGDAASSHVNIEYSTDNQQTWKPVKDAGGNPAYSTPNDGSFTWQVPDDANFGAYIKITSKEYPTIFGISNIFDIKGLEITTPNGGEVYELGSRPDVSWTARETYIAPNSISLKYTTQDNAPLTGAALADPAIWHFIANEQPATGTCTWRITTDPAMASDTVKVVAYDVNTPSTIDTSNANFALVKPPEFANITAGVTGGDYYVGDTLPISWETNSKLFATKFNLKYAVSIDGASFDFNDANSSGTVVEGVDGAPSSVWPAPNTHVIGNYATFVIPEIPKAYFTEGTGSSTQLEVMIAEDATTLPSRTTTTAVSKASAAVIVKRPTITVTRPLSSDVWTQGDTRTITWTSRGTVHNQLNLMYSIEKDGGGNWTNWQAINVSPEQNDGTFSWTVLPQQVAEAIALKIVEQDLPYNTESDVVEFKTIGSPQIFVDQPTASSSIAVGDDIVINWHIFGESAKDYTYNIYYAKNGVYNMEDYIAVNKGTTFSSVTGRCDGTYTWQGSRIPSSVATDRWKIKIIKQAPGGVDDPSFQKESDEFIIADTSLKNVNVTPATLYAYGQSSISFELTGRINGDLVIKYLYAGGEGTVVSIPGANVKQNGTNYVWNSVTHTGTYTWQHVANILAGKTAMIKIYDSYTPEIYATKDNIAVVAPSITIDPATPAAGQTLKMGDIYPVQWTSSGDEVNAISGQLQFQFKDGSGAWVAGTLIDASDNPVTNIPPEGPAGTYRWMVPVNCRSVVAGATSGAQIRIVDTMSGAAAVSVPSSYFTISKPTIDIEKPKTIMGEPAKYVMGMADEIYWYVSPGVSKNIKVSYSLNGGADNFPYTIDTFDDTTHQPQQKPGQEYYYCAWNVPVLENAGVLTKNTNVLVKVEDIATGRYLPGEEPSKISDTFTIDLPRFDIKPLNEGNPLAAGDSTLIEWEPKGTITGPLLIEYSSRGLFETGDVYLIAGGVNASATSYQWDGVGLDAYNNEILAPGTGRIRITDTSRTEVRSTSNLFSILTGPHVNITVPSAGANCVMGTPQQVSWINNNDTVGQHLQLYYMLPGTPDRWILIRDNLDRAGTITWTVPSLDPETSQVLSNNIASRLKIVDPDRNRTISTDPYNITIKIPDINIISPTPSTIWALGDEVSIEAVQDPVNSSLVGSLQFLYSPTGADGSYTLFTAQRQGTSNIYKWVYPPGVSDQMFGADPHIMVRDSGRQNSFKDTKVNVIPKPRITNVTVTSPNYPNCILGETLTITWECEGSRFGNFTVKYNNDTQVKDITPAGLSQDSRSCTFTIPDGSDPANMPLVGRNCIKVSVKSSTRSDIDEKWIDVPFSISGGFVLKQPAPAVRWATNEERNIVWDTKGDIRVVDIYYATYYQSDGVPPVTSPAWQKITPTAGLSITPGPNNFFTWKIPNDRTDKEADAIGNPKYAVVRVVDHNDSLVTYPSAPFDIVWYTIKWHVRDFDGKFELTEVDAAENSYLNYDGWITSPQYSLTSPIIREYPYGNYTTYFKKTGYDSFSAPLFADGGTPENPKDVYADMLNSSTSMWDWHVVTSYAYLAQTKTIDASAWLEKKGRLVGAEDNAELEKLQKATFNVYASDGATLLYTREEPVHDIQGVYRFSWTDTENRLEAGKTYFIKATIVYGAAGYTPVAYSSGGSINVTADVEHYAQQAMLSAIQGQVVETTISSKTIPAQIQEVKNLIGTPSAESGGTLVSQIAASQKTLSQNVTDAQQAVQSTERAQILNRDTTVEGGQTLTIRYRTSGSNPQISVYDPKNVLRVSGSMLPSAVATGGVPVYEYAVRFESSWGRGDFSVICSDAGGNMDAVVITVTSAGLETISGQVASVISTTTGISELKTAAETMNSQFSVIESALSKVTRDMTLEAAGVGGTGGASKSLDSIYGQIETMAKQIKTISGEAGVNLSKLYDVSKDKKGDIKYLKNKTQEIKAAMKVNQKMMENIANKPVTQTWYEYK